MEMKNITIRLHGIELMERSYMNIAPPPEDHEFKFDFSMKAGIDPDRKLIVVLTELLLKKGDEAALLAKLVVATAFELPNIEEELPKLENGQYGIPDELDMMVKSISLSTARGILFSELRGTPFHKAYLPLIQLPLAHPVLPQPEPAN